METSSFSSFQMFSFHFPTLKFADRWCLLLAKEYSDEDFRKFIQFYSYGLLKSLH